MRGKHLLACLAVIPVVLAGIRGEAATERTCHWWHDLTFLGSNGYARSFKLGYIAGFAQGAYTFIAQARSEEKLMKDLVGEGAPHEMTTRLKSLMASMEESRGGLDLVGFTTDELVNGLDQLCADGANEEIDVHDGLKIVRWELDGTPRAQIDRELEHLREGAARGQRIGGSPR